MLELHSFRGVEFCVAASFSMRLYINTMSDRVNTFLLFFRQFLSKYPIFNLHIKKPGVSSRLIF